MTTPVELLVSVRDVSEARSALEGGAGLIDVKEPSRGALGCADAAVIRAIAAEVAGRRPVSAALGELVDGLGPVGECALTYVKWGLAGCRGWPGWRQQLEEALGRRHGPQVVVAAYADWECAKAPPIDELFALAAKYPGSVMLLDTHCKDARGVRGQRRPTLLDWLPLAWIEDLVARCRQANVKIALAGSLGETEIRVLLPARPNWFAVRGAVCADSDRNAAVQVDKVRRLVELLRSQEITLAGRAGDELGYHPSLAHSANRPAN